MLHPDTYNNKLYLYYLLLLPQKRKKVKKEKISLLIGKKSTLVNRHKQVRFLKIQVKINKNYKKVKSFIF